MQKKYINGDFIRTIKEEDRIDYLLDTVFESDYILGKIDNIVNDSDVFVTICSPKNIKEIYMLDNKKWDVYFNLNNVRSDLKNNLKKGDLIYFEPSINNRKPEQIIQIKPTTIQKVVSYKKFLEVCNIEQNDIILNGNIAIEKLDDFNEEEFNLWATETFYKAFDNMHSDLLNNINNKQIKLKELDEEKLVKEEEIKQAYCELENEKDEITSKELELDLQQKEIDRFVEKLKFFGFNKFKDEKSILGNETEYKNYNYDEIFEYIKSYIRNNEKLIYSDDIIRRFLVCMQSEEFTILSGPSGTGKTSIVTAFAKATGGEAKIIPVKPSWTDTEDLIGFYNPIEKSYVATPFLDALVEAKENKNKIYLICLDEMNLSHIEYYFAEFLSKMEINKDKKSIELYSKHIYEEMLEEIVYDMNLMTGDTIIPQSEDVIDWCKKEIEKWCDKNKKEYTKQMINIRKKIKFIERYPSEFQISNNVRFIGTMNVDQTTKNISPKVIDRSFVIELLNYNTFNSEVDMEGVEEEQRYIKSDSFAFIDNDLNGESEEIIEEIMEINQEYLYDLGANFNNRTKKHLQRYLSCILNYNFSIEQKHIISDLVYLKLLPRISVSYKNKNDDKYLSWNSLESELQEICNEDVQMKLNRMDKISKDDNMLSFWGVY